MKTTSVYIHIPFCKNICSYCDFCKMYYHQKWTQKYLAALKSEINNRYQNEEIKTIYIGGGTPSALSITELKELFRIINIFKTNHLKEFTFECNPSDINKELITLLKNNKVNRISIGIESFNKENLLFMNREAEYKDIQNKIKMIKEIGINNINVDLIYALPSENMEILKQDLELITSLDVNHISTYSLMIEKGTVIDNKKTKPISEDQDALMYQTICDYLKKKNYHHYEVSNFAKKGSESCHNLVYWHNEEYYGFGLGASGYINNQRYDNTKNLTSYLKGDYIKDSVTLSNDDKIEYELILGLRLLKGINVKKFYDKYHIDIEIKYPKIKELINNNELIIKNGYLFINPPKIYIMNEILVQLI